MNAYQNFRERGVWLSRLTAADNSDKVKVSYPTSRDRYARYTKVEGERDSVLDHVAWLIQHDSCTPMYEHMLMRVVTFDEFDDIAVVTLFKTLYAGD